MHHGEHGEHGDSPRKEIAAALDLSPRTIETHKYQVMDTLGVSSTAELVRYAIEHKLFVD